MDRLTPEHKPIEFNPFRRRLHRRLGGQYVSPPPTLEKPEVEGMIQFERERLAIIADPPQGLLYF